MKQTKFGKFLKIVGIIFLGLTAAFHIIGGAGTTCVAIGAEKYDSMVGIEPYKWLYIIFVVLTIAIGVYGLRATIQYARSRKNSYRDAMIALIAGLIVSAIHMFTSKALRGASMPTDGRVYMNAITLVLFLIFGLPQLKAIMGGEKESEDKAGNGGLGAAFILMGLMTLTVQFWAGGTHTWNQFNFADVWHTELSIVGGLQILGGLAVISRTLLIKRKSALLSAKEIKA